MASLLASCAESVSDREAQQLNGCSGHDCSEPAGGLVECRVPMAKVLTSPTGASGMTDQKTGAALGPALPALTCWGITSDSLKLPGPRFIPPRNAYGATRSTKEDPAYEDTVNSRSIISACEAGSKRSSGNRINLPPRAKEQKGTSHSKAAPQEQTSCSTDQNH